MENSKNKKDMQDTLAENQTEETKAPEAPKTQKAPKAPKTEEQETSIVNELVDELGVISEATRVEGDVETKGHLAIAGTVDGKVSAKGNVIITGVVRGRIKCRDLVLDKCNLNAEIQATGNVTIKSGTVSGDITCNDLNIKGTVNGNINAAGTVALASDAKVKGDIKAARMGMEIGAVIDGKISITG